MGRVAMAALMLSACSLDRGSVGGQEVPPDSRASLDASSSDASVSGDASLADGAREAGPTPDGATDGGRFDAGLDAAADGASGDGAVDVGTDAGCPAPETCNGRDDDCNGIIDDGAGCPCHLRRYMDRPYLFCEESRDWSSARGRCTSVGYDLVIFETPEENDWAWMAAANLSNYHDWWLGLRDEGSDGTYEWVDGTTVWDGGTVGFTNFRGSGNPDGSGPCVEMGDENGTSMDGSWNDTPCSSLNYFVCEVSE